MLVHIKVNYACLQLLSFQGIMVGNTGIVCAGKNRSRSQRLVLLPGQGMSPAAETVEVNRCPTSRGYKAPVELVTRRAVDPGDPAPIGPLPCQRPRQDSSRRRQSDADRPQNAQYPRPYAVTVYALALDCRDVFRSVLTLTFKVRATVLLEFPAASSASIWRSRAESTLSGSRRPSWAPSWTNDFSTGAAAEQVPEIAALIRV